MLAAKLGLAFVDTDNEIAADNHWNSKQHPCSVRDLHQQLGETAFRTLEQQAVFSLKSRPQVIATGGSTLLNHQNTQYLKTLGSCIHLALSESAFLQRLQDHPLPSFIRASHWQTDAQAYYRSRYPVYLELADRNLMIDSLTPHQCLHHLLDLIVDDGNNKK